MDERRLRAWQALELGPLWRERRGAGLPQAGAGGPEPIPESTLEPSLEPIPEPIPEPTLDGEAVSASGAAAAGHGRPPAPPVPGTSPDAVAPPVAGRAEVGVMGWPELRAAVASCSACGLCEGRNRTVFGAGPEDARWLVVGEGPGAEEDASGEPFVGQAGRLLDAMLASIDLDRRRNAFIANVVKCRPPGNRNPLPDETARCLPFLRRQVELLAPDFVLLLGRVAAHALLETDAPVGSLRGRVHRLRAGGREIPAVVTWHPSYLLRRPEEKALAWADLCLARERFEAATEAAAGD